MFMFKDLLGMSEDTSQKFEELLAEDRYDIHNLLSRALESFISHNLMVLEPDCVFIYEC